MNKVRSSERRLQLICRASRRQHRKSEIARQEKSWSVRKVCTGRDTGRLGSIWRSIDLITINCGLYLRKSLACCRLAWPNRRRRSDVSRTPAEGLHRYFLKLPAAISIATPSSTALGDRKSTRLNSSHVKISYAVFC